MTTPRLLDIWLQSVGTRRSFLAGGLALAGLASVRPAARAASRLGLQTSPFSLGVASGDPSADGVVLWTRLAPDPLNGGGMPPAPVAVTWQIATDDRLKNVVRGGETMARPEWGHSVHVEATGLQPDRWYWYQFRTGNELSPIGRTRTLPRANAAANRLRFAFVSCQHYEQGYFTAHQHLAAEDVDVVLHLGDYIYEGPGNPAITTRVRHHIGPEITTLEHYRNRYALYRSDLDLQAAHAACPWIVTWDDHEVDDNYADAISHANDPREAFLVRRAAAYQAYYEHMPLRRSSIPAGPSLRLYRQFAYGTLASLFVLDTRQYRTDQPCQDGTKVPCEDVANPKATLLGDAQEKWFMDGLDRSRAAWNIVPQQIMMAKVDQFPGAEARYSMDQWSGYDVERTRVLEFLARRRPANPIVLAGDIHSNWVNDLKVDFADPKSPVIATEFVGTSISSGGDGADTAARTAGVLAENPFVKFYNGQRGYVACEITPSLMRARYEVLEYVTRPGSPHHTRATFVVESGRPGAVRE